MHLQRELLKVLRRLLGRTLSRARRRKSTGPIVLAVLVVAVFLVDKLLERPRAGRVAQGTELACRVDKVYDGDTLDVLCEDGLRKVRVWGIDAPEMKQNPWGSRALERLRAELPDTVRIKVLDVDRYDRAVAQLFDGERDLGLDLVRQGYAAVYRQYNDSRHYRDVEAGAKRAGRGIWSRAGAQQAPWEWRRLNPR